MFKSTYLIPLIKEYLNYCNIYPNTNELRLILESDPSFPSLLSLRRTCIYFGLSIKAYKADYDALLENKSPAIVHFNIDNGERFVILKNVTTVNVTYFDATNLQINTISKETFCEVWSRVVVISEKIIKQSISKSKAVKISSMIYGLVLFALLLAFVFGSQYLPSNTVLYYTLGLLLFKLIGVWLTANIIKHEAVFVYSPFESFCNKLESFDCNKVLNSNASRLFNPFSLGDIGLVYFSTSVLAIMISVLSGLQNEILLLLFYMAVGGIPFVLFSIFYQKFIVKKWCPLCLGVVGLVVLENLVFLLYQGKTMPNSSFLLAGVMLILSIIFSILIVHFFKNLIKAQGDAFTNKLLNLQLKRNPAVLISLFNRQKKSEIPQKHSIVIGKKESPLVITTLLSPVCKPCKRMTREILQLTEKHPESFLWQIRFDGIAKKVYDPINRIQLHIKQLCDNEKDNSAKIQIIKDWYSRQSYQWFAARYPIDKIALETIVGLAEQINENAALDVNRVPVLWINNRMLPQEYSVTDIPLLCTDVNLLLQLTK